MTPKLVLATRNRPRHVKDLLRYLAKFYPGSQIVVADGSHSDVQPVVGAICADARAALDITFQAYPAETPLFARLLSCIQGLDDDHLAMTADDDYPILETYAQAAHILASSDAVSTVVPFDVILNQDAADSISAVFSASRPIMDKTPARRVENFSKWSFATSYGVSRRATLIARYTALSQTYCPGFIDYQIGLEDCLEGCVAAMPDLGCIRTHSYQGAYLRPADRLVFLRKSSDALAIVDHIARRLTQNDTIDAPAAHKIAQKSMMNRIAELVGSGHRTRHGFATSSMFLDPIVQAQYDKFYALFEHGTQARAAYVERLTYVKELLVAQSQDLPAEGNGNYENL
jgi:glycosyltransferase domain-containing protein